MCFKVWVPFCSGDSVVCAAGMPRQWKDLVEDKHLSRGRQSVRECPLGCAYCLGEKHYHYRLHTLYMEPEGNGCDLSKALYRRFRKENLQTVAYFFGGVTGFIRFFRRYTSIEMPIHIHILMHQYAFFFVSGSDISLIGALNLCV
jgi:hypothetical protein